MCQVIPGTPVTEIPLPNGRIALIGFEDQPNRISFSQFEVVQLSIGGNLNDTIESGKIIFGLSGDDTLRGYREDNQIFGNAGNDILKGFAGNNLLYGGQGNDRVIGGSGDDSIGGEKGNDVLFGNLGDDIIRGSDGSDRLFGGEGNDILFGEQDNDLLIGNDGIDILYGGQGDDTLRGDSGNDILVGDKGNDRLIGGTESDTFVFNQIGEMHADTIVDFDLTLDRIALDRQIFRFDNLDSIVHENDFLVISNFNPNNYNPEKVTPHLVYDNVRGRLFYIENNQIQLVAEFLGKPSLINDLFELF